MASAPGHVNGSDRWSRDGQWSGVEGYEALPAGFLAVFFGAGAGAGARSAWRYAIFTDAR